MGVSENNGVSPPNHPNLIGFCHYFHHPFWGTSIFGNTHIRVAKFLAATCGKCCCPASAAKCSRLFCVLEREQSAKVRCLESTHLIVFHWGILSSSMDILYIYMLVTIDISNNQVVVEPTHLKNMIVKLDHIPKFRGGNKKKLKPPPRWRCTPSEN